MIAAACCVMALDHNVNFDSAGHVEGDAQHVPNVYPNVDVSIQLCGQESLCLRPAILKKAWHPTTEGETHRKMHPNRVF